jgi:murein DD-endopeptidase MepM/ murein hydrolase activator NlpD
VAILARLSTELWTPIVETGLKIRTNISLALSLLLLSWAPDLAASAGDPPLAAAKRAAVVSDTTEPEITGLALLNADTTEPYVPVIAALRDSSDSTTGEPKKAGEPVVQTPVSALEALEEGDEFYEDWDTSSVHSAKFDALVFTDTVLVPLYDPQHCTYTHPFNGQPTSEFGFRRYRYHFGVDINLETGDSVKCAFDGKVRIAQYSKSYGNLVVVRHDNGLETYYAHLSKLLVKPGQTLEAGNLVGLGGNTGHSHGSHLHFEVRFRGQPIDPNMIIDFKAQRLRTDTLMLTQSHFKYLTETHKVVRRSRRRTRVTYYTPGGAHYATPDAKAVMAKVPAPAVPGNTSTAPAATPNPGAPAVNNVPQKSASASTTAAKKTTTTTTAAKGKAVYHTVKKGDTLSAIAVRYGTSVTKLCQLNGIKSTTTLQIGRKLRVK